MTPVARKNLLADRVRLLVSVGGVTFAVVLILVVQSLYRGFDREMGAFVEDLPVDVWVMEQDTNGLLYPSLIPVEREPEVRAVAGVASVVRLYRKRMTVGHGQATTDSYFVSYDLPQPLATAMGLAMPDPGTVIIGHTFARLNNLRVGDVLTISGRQFTVSRVIDLASIGLTQISLMHPQDARELLTVPGYVGYLLVVVAPGADPAQVARSIEASVPGVRAMTRDAFAAANRSEVSGAFLPIVGVLLVVAFLVGCAVVGITIYTATVERSREYGVLKAIGASSGQLLRIVVTQSTLVGLAGFVIGIPLTYIVNEVAIYFVPEFTTLILPRDILTVLAAAFGMALAATAIPIRRIARIDPAEVFRA